MLQTRISLTPQPGEERLTRESRDLLASLRSVPPIPEEDDPNGWYHQIREHLLRSPRERMERWAWFVGGDPRRGGDQCEMQHVRFDPVRVVRTLCDYEVAFVVVGMGAGYLRGAPYPSYNIDITPSLDSENLAGLERVLEVLEARPLEKRRVGVSRKTHSALRHSSLTDLAAMGANSAQLQAKSRHRNRSVLETYTTLGDAEVSELTGWFDRPPGGRRR